MWSWPSSVRITREFVRNAVSQAPLQTRQVRICISKRPTSDSGAFWSLKSAARSHKNLEKGQLTVELSGQRWFSWRERDIWKRESGMVPTGQREAADWHKGRETWGAERHHALGTISPGRNQRFLSSSVCTWGKLLLKGSGPKTLLNWILPTKEWTTTVSDQDSCRHLPPASAPCWWMGRELGETRQTLWRLWVGTP